MPTTISGTDGVSLVQDGVVSANKLANNAVITDKINNSSVTSAKLADGSITASKLQTGSVAQIVTQVENIASNLTSTNVVDTGLTPLTLTRRLSTSKILIDFFGGRWTGGISGGSTYFFVSENSGTYRNIVNTGLSAVEYFYDGNGAGLGPHIAKYAYTPSPSVSTIDLKIYYFTSGGGSYPWHTGNTEPFTTTITEIV